VVQRFNKGFNHSMFKIPNIPVIIPTRPISRHYTIRHPPDVDACMHSESPALSTLILSAHGRRQWASISRQKSILIYPLTLSTRHEMLNTVTRLAPILYHIHTHARTQTPIHAHMYFIRLYIHSFFHLFIF
jgi:hypothetical protein